MENTLEQNQKVYFIGENLPMTVMAVSERYAVVSRKLNKKEDDDLLDFEVERGAYSSKEKAFQKLKDSPVYSILDFQENIKGSDNLILGMFDYDNPKDCEQAIKALEQSRIEISCRNRATLTIDWTTTNFNN